LFLFGVISGHSIAVVSRQKAGQARRETGCSIEAVSRQKAGQARRETGCSIEAVRVHGVDVAAVRFRAARQI
jgi:hypothetical protein